MAKFRETACLFYIAAGQCKKNRAASYSGYCQHCNKYRPRAKMHHINQKKKHLYEIKEKERYE